MTEVHIRDEFIKLGQALKLCGAVSSGLDAKIVINEGQVRVNGQVELQRGKKLHPGDKFEFEDKIYEITA